MTVTETARRAGSELRQSFAVTSLTPHLGAQAGGGDTLSADMYLAYELLSPSMQSFLEGLTAVHDGGVPYVGRYGERVSVIGAERPTGVRPVPA